MDSSRRPLLIQKPKAKKSLCNRCPVHPGILFLHRNYTKGEDWFVEIMIIFAKGDHTVYI
ncbi:MAG: hypothetical protein JST09_11340 [Bacteroidetes bacterium]|nr:hypothetical protein [Bacteroidota bacterium]MBS1609815.1 hypothetical protein [Bacteroidota bacterium]